MMNQRQKKSKTTFRIISPNEHKENSIEYLNQQLNKAMQAGDIALQRQYLEQIVQYNRNRM